MGMRASGGQHPPVEGFGESLPLLDRVAALAQHGLHLRRKIGGVSEKMLAQSLQALEQDGFLNRIAYPVVPPHVEYSLTPLGEQVSEKVAALADWIELNLPEVLAVRDERAA